MSSVAPPNQTWRSPPTDSRRPSFEPKTHHRRQLQRFVRFSVFWFLQKQILDSLTGKSSKLALRRSLKSVNRIKVSSKSSRACCHLSVENPHHPSARASLSGSLTLKRLPIFPFVSELMRYKDRLLVDNTVGSDLDCTRRLGPRSSRCLAEFRFPAP